jgi:TLD
MGDLSNNIQSTLSQTIQLPLFGDIILKDVSTVTLLTIVPLLVLSMKPPAQLVDKSTLSNIVEGTFMERNFENIRCVYKASKDGWSAIKFHDFVDGKGSGVVVARTISGRIFGGYNANGWRSTDDYYSSTSSFLWYKDPSSASVKKLPVLPGGDAAVFDYATSGPCFGSSDLIIGPPRAAIMGGFAGPDGEDISNSAGSLRQCRSSVGSTYRVTREMKWPVFGTTSLVDVEVYCVDRE